MQKVFLYDPSLTHNTSVMDRQRDGWTDKREMTMVPSTPTA